MARHELARAFHREKLVAFAPLPDAFEPRFGVSVKPGRQWSQFKLTFADSHLAADTDDNPAHRGITGTNVLRRDLIDLGWGVDETFEDQVPA